MQSWEDAVGDEAERTGFSGVVHVEREGQAELLGAYGFADRAHGIANSTQTLFATASGTKGLTALTTMALVEQGALELRTPARSLLGDDLPLVGDDVTIEHLLAHRGGIGDYFDEAGDAEITDYVLPVPVHTLAATEDYLPILEGHPSVFHAGERFSYNNAGYVVLALLAERATGAPFPELVRSLVCSPAAMTDTEFLRSDELPGRAAIGYLRSDSARTNVLHLPVRGSGDGGAYSTAADFAAFWRALFAGEIVSAAAVGEMTRPRSDWPSENRRYGLGFHLHAVNDAVFLEGYDAGVSFTSLHRPSTALTYTVLSNWSDGAWPIVKVLNRLLGL